MSHDRDHPVRRSIEGRDRGDSENPGRPESELDDDGRAQRPRRGFGGDGADREAAGDQRGSITVSTGTASAATPISASGGVCAVSRRAADGSDRLSRDDARGFPRSPRREEDGRGCRSRRRSRGSGGPSSRPTRPGTYRERSVPAIPLLVLVVSVPGLVPVLAERVRPAALIADHDLPIFLKPAAVRSVPSFAQVYAAA